MEMLGTRQLGVTQQQAWEALNDPETLKACLAGCDKFEAAGDDTYSVGMAVKIGPVSAKFSGKVMLTEITPPQGYKLSFEGQGGVAGFGKGASSVTLTPNDAGCELGYTVQAQVGGKIAQLGQRLVDGAAKSMADDFFKRFDALMAQRYPDAANDDDEEGGGTSFGAIDSLEARTRPMSMAAASAPSMQKWIWIGVAVVIAIGAALYLRG
ncbi:CoxG family protein [Variovorax fucosicus]|uniref:CoxG family protein n=1 Tax=Variovorax fucosicus TaxID=3053517 RepID=UPI002577F9C1|nr:carbon monoxide dehydrogenase subunit G [Variovorax sp. J22G47]MDM0058540.1 carbon monoxide dehydrogenase subunit G [Variovorax sp. J22G47]